MALTSLCSCWSWRSSVGRTALDGLINPRTLVFLDPIRERGFLAAQHEHLVSNFALGVFCLLAHSALHLVLIAFSPGTNGGVFVDSSGLFTTPWGQARTAAFALCAGAAVLTLAFIAAGGLRCVLKVSGFAGFEVLLVTLLCAGTFAAYLTDPWYCARIVGADGTAVLAAGSTFDDARFLLFIDAVVTFANLSLPIRSVVMWVHQSCAVLSYVVVAVVLGSPMTAGDICMNTFLLALLTVFAGMGRRSAERSQRAAFVNIATERTKRTEAEHQLHCASEEKDIQKHHAPRASASDTRSDVASSAVTTYTGNMFFKAAADPESHDAVQRIEQLGSQEHWLIPVDHLKPVRGPGAVLGRGSYGLVLHASYHGLPVAVKIPLSDAASEGTPSKAQGPSTRGFAAIAQELRVLRRLRHPNIVLMHGACCDTSEKSELWLVLEYVSGGRLDVVVSQAPPVGPDLSGRLRLARDVCSALAYLHAQEPPVIHGDIKPGNVLVEALDSTLRAKLVDFGLSRLATLYQKPLGGTRGWAAPEVFSSLAQPLPSADIYSFGELFGFTLTWSVPKEELNPDEIPQGFEVRGIAEGGRAYLPLVDACKQHDKHLRPSAREVLERLPADGSTSLLSLPPGDLAQPHAAEGGQPECFKTAVNAARSEALAARLARLARRQNRAQSSTTVCL